MNSEGLAAGFCQHCKEEGYEARGVKKWIAREGTLREYLQAL